MKFIMDNWMLIMVAFASGAMLVWPAARGRGAGAPPNVVVQMINREKAIIVDVGETEEFAAGHLGGARNVPVGQLEQRLPEVAKNKALRLVFVCATGARANRAVGIAEKLGYEKAIALAGGLNAWKEANLPVEKG
ncbi:MAG: rhodanese-like domain-containing protein [Burkholderiales bacterium]|nr:rhodanese-like domain-containing protein [Burkholderiales bacterium]